MKLEHINKYDEQAGHLAYVHDQIIDRINTLISKQYNVKYVGNDDKFEIYNIYRKPTYTKDANVQNIYKFLAYNIMFLIDDWLNLKKYYYTTLRIKDNEIYVNAYGEKKTKMMETNLMFWFNSIEDSHAIIIRTDYGNSYK